MAINLDQFEQTFFEESFEGLEVLEAGLLGLSEGAGKGTIDDIFRAAHSIKGGSGTFGFSDITGLTHFLETLLENDRIHGVAPFGGKWHKNERLDEIRLRSFPFCCDFS